MRPFLIAALVAGLAGGASAPPAPGGIQRAALLDTGTLVVVIPTADGAVVAADSRGTVSDGSVNDHEQKIVRSIDQPVAAFATGTTSVSFRGKGRAGRVRVDYDVSALLLRELGKLDHVPQTDDARRIVEAVGDAVRRSHVSADGQLKNQHIVIGLVTFSPDGTKTSIYVGHLDMDAASRLAVDVLPVVEMDGDRAVRLGVYGNGDYATAHLLRGAGLARLSPETRRLLNARRIVRDLRSPAAYAAAKDIIEAVSRRMADDHLPRVTVGGPTRGVLVGPSGVSVLDDGAAQ